MESEAFEFGVALMLIGLGWRAIYQAARQGVGTAPVHHHGPVVHTHPGVRHMSTSAAGRSHGGRCWSAPSTASPAAAR